MRRCTAFMVAAPGSGHGKTFVTAVLACHFRRQGKQVRVFKVGPDFIDPMILECASGHPVYQLDLWMGGMEHCRQLLETAAAEADVILIEGVMGLFDGTPSSAELAVKFGLSVMLVVDASAMAQSFGAVVYGMTHYDKSLEFAGVIANRVAGEGHWKMLRDSLNTRFPSLGWLLRDESYTLPERHLGLVQASEIADLDQRIQKAADAIQFEGPDFPAVTFTASVQDDASRECGEVLQGCRIAVAYDKAFSFVYRANLDMLRGMGAALHFFSPLEKEPLPDADAVYIPGGYPELYLEQLSEHISLRTALSAHVAEGKPVLAEGGGMLYLLEALSDAKGGRAAQLGILPGEAFMTDRLVNLGLHEVSLPEGCVRGHTFHYARIGCCLKPLVYSAPKRDHGRTEPVYRRGRLTASCLHLYFPSNPAAIARLFLP